MCQIFYPLDKFERIDAARLKDNGFGLMSEVSGAVCRAAVFIDGQAVYTEAKQLLDMDDAAVRRAVKQTVYAALVSHTGYVPPWGNFTGIRPSKIFHDHWARGQTEADAIRHMRGVYAIDMDKIALALDVAKAERQLMQSLDTAPANGETFGLYIGIPFCPTRCLYCSFTSYPLARHAHQVDRYLDCLMKEMAALSCFGKSRRLESVYIGGGTPTALDAEQLDRLLEGLYASFHVDKALELTVEAGRPDTITRDKLAVMKRHGVSRISINPQSLSAETLAAIGRGHTPAQFAEAFLLARDMGFDNINVDLIVGLPGEGPAHIRHTVGQLARFAPESVTVHTLAVKRASQLKEAEAMPVVESAALAAMVDTAKDAALSMGLRPYYMYRQKNMVGHYENVGYCKPKHDCIYNVRMMADNQTIVAVGAGAVTKVFYAAQNRLERIFNVKNVDDYMNRIDEMLGRKDVLR